jgi:hypothetical protein
VPLSWKEDLEDSETEMDNFVSQFTIWFKEFFFSMVLKSFEQT